MLSREHSWPDHMALQWKSGSQRNNAWIGHRRRLLQKHVNNRNSEKGFPLVITKYRLNHLGHAHPPPPQMIELPLLSMLLLWSRIVDAFALWGLWGNWSSRFRGFVIRSFPSKHSIIFWLLQNWAKLYHQHDCKIVCRLLPALWASATHFLRFILNLFFWFSAKFWLFRCPSQSKPPNNILKF